MISKDTLIGDKAKWENKANIISEQNESKRKFQQFHDQRKQFMDIRRKKLSDLLKREEEAYRLEIISIQETPNQVRQKMETKLKNLLEVKEKERLELVEKLNERKFYADADELRKNDSEAFAIECYLEQENQMLDKLRKKQLDKQEEEIYVKLNELDIKRKAELELKQLEEIDKKKKETHNYLEWQKIQMASQEKRNKELLQLENDRIKTQWISDNNREQQEKIDRVIKNKEVYKNIQEFNRVEEEVRKKRSDIEKAKDRELIDAIVNKEKGLDEIDRKEKERKKSEFFQNKKYLEYVMNQKKEAELWMDQIVANEADKKWKKDQENWMKQENARIELLKQVYKERENAIMHKRNVEKEERDQFLKQRAVLEKEISDYNKRLEEIKVEEAIRRKAHQDDLKYQMREKALFKEKEKQDQIYDERAAKLWEIEYLKKINAQKEIHMKRLSEIKNRGMEQ